MVEEDCDTEIVQLKIHFDKRLEREKEILLQLKGDNGLIKKRNTMLHKKYDEQEARIRAVLALHESANCVAELFCACR